jgi:hypothetical protein
VPLSTALTYVVASLLHMMPTVAFVGLVAGIGLDVFAGWRTEKALKRLVQ